MILTNFSGLASSFIDNIPFTTMMIPVIKNLADSSAVNIPLQPLGKSVVILVFSCLLFFDNLLFSLELGSWSLFGRKRNSDWSFGQYCLCRGFWATWLQIFIFGFFQSRFSNHHSQYFCSKHLLADMSCCNRMEWRIIWSSIQINLFLNYRNKIDKKYRSYNFLHYTVQKNVTCVWFLFSFLYRFEFSLASVQCALQVCETPNDFFG